MLKILFCALLSPIAFSHPVHRVDPPVYLFPETENSSQITEMQTLALIDFFRNEMNPDFGATHWQVDFNWKQAYLGAGSSFYDQTFHIMLWGGMVRATSMTAGALAAILCHEAGHKLAGPPLQHFPNEEAWSSAEGQSDHYASTVCLPRLYQALRSAHSPLLQTSEEPEARKLCRNSKDPAQCVWVATSGIDFIQFIQVYYDRDVPFADPSVNALEKPESTLHTAYPSYQCRMDIFKQGAPCDQGLKCPRSRCWFVN
jgi:hypothetical protein